MTSKKEDKDRDNIRLFVSYAKEDSSQAAELMSQLARQPKFHVFTASKMSGGENWRSRIKKELSRTDYFLVLLSPTSVQSKWVQFELGVAWGLNKFIIPVVTSHDVVHRIPLEFEGLKVIELKDLKGKPESIGQIIESYEKTAA
ncbi:MAG TPA: toll/interleukin-1 receptor domain-containing protein [Pyrinomonadaceae bacterium]|nr:toll/interleukin-1 receptor domain-containing protein [Pyrinomonadaceae bacterium]